MRWIDIKQELPEQNERVLVWIKYENESEFEWTDAELDFDWPENYIEPNSGKSWLMGSARNFIITHWMRIESPVTAKLDIKTECKWRHVDVGMYGCNDYVYQTSCNTEFDADKTHKSKFCPNCGDVVV